MGDLNQEFSRFKDIIDACIEVKLFLFEYGVDAYIVQIAVEKLKAVCLEYRLFDIDYIDEISYFYEDELERFCLDLIKKAKFEFGNALLNEHVGYDLKNLNIFYEGYEILCEIHCFLNIEHTGVEDARIILRTKKFEYYRLKYNLSFEADESLIEFKKMYPASEIPITHYTVIMWEMCDKIRE